MTYLKLFVLTATLFLLGQKIKGQTVTFINDTTNIIYSNILDNTDIDSVVSIKDWNSQYSEWKVYFDKTLNHLAYESFLIGDTCLTIDYWRNGKIKKKSTYVKNSENFFIWWCEKQFCQNGQLIVEWCPYQFTEKVLITRYYCNGQKQMQWTQSGIGAEGLITKWYYNGQKKSETNYVNNKEEGEWRFWDEKGNLEKIEVWNEGKLIETK